MKILHLDAGQEMRGGQWQALRLIEGLTAAGVQSKLLAPPSAPLFALASERGLPVAPLSLARVAMASTRFDLVHAHDARSHTLALASACPLVVSRRVAFPPKSRWKYAHPRCFLAVSECVRDVLISAGIPPEKIEVVYDGVPLLDPAHGDAILAPDSRADPKKGAALAIEAARLAGVDLQFSSDLERDLAHASLLIYATYSEGLGSATLLAMSAGVPVIASDIGGLREIIRHNENGLLAENTPLAFARAITALCSDSALATRLGAAGRRTVLERFTLECVVSRTMEVYRRVLS
jgi:Glycosyl transferases group 1/Glycosyltransferase Family 4